MNHYKIVIIIILGIIISIFQQGIIINGDNFGDREGNIDKSCLEKTENGKFADDKQIWIKDYSSILKTNLEKINDGDDIELTLKKETITENQFKTTNNYLLGENDSFWIQDIWKAGNGIDDDSDGLEYSSGDYDEAMYELNAECKVISDNAYFFVDIGLGSSYDQYLDDLAIEYENNIKLNVTNAFGEIPDIDFNEKIIILIFDIKDFYYYGESGGIVAGYFWSLHNYEKSSNPDDFAYYSEEKEIIHIDILTFDYDITNDTIAHELQHLIHYDKDPDETTWLDEGMAVLAEYLCGYEEGWKDYVDQYFMLNDVSLAFWDEKITNYGIDFLFMLYIRTQFGDEAIKQIVINKDNSIDSIMEVLQNFGYTGQIKDLIRDWSICNWINNPIYSEKYSYPVNGYLDNKSIIREISIPIPIESQDINIIYWGVEYIAIPLVSGNYEMNVESNSMDIYAFVVLIKDDNSIEITETHTKTSTTVCFQLSEDVKSVKLIIVNLSGDPNEELYYVPSGDIALTINKADYLIFFDNFEFTMDNRFLKIDNIVLQFTNGSIIDNKSVIQAYYYLYNINEQRQYNYGFIAYDSTFQCWKNENYVQVHKFPRGEYVLYFEFELDIIIIRTNSPVIEIDYLYLYESIISVDYSERVLSINKLQIGNTSDTLWDSAIIGQSEYILYRVDTNGKIIEEVNKGNLEYQDNYWSISEIAIKDLPTGKYQFCYKFNFLSANDSYIKSYGEIFELNIDNSKDNEQKISGFGVNIPFIIVFVVSMKLCLFNNRKRIKDRNEQ